MARYRYFVTRAAEQGLKMVDAIYRQRIGRKLQYFISVDNPLVFTVQLTSVKPAVYRFRIGKYRVFFDIKDDTLRILNVSLRDKAYYR